MTDLHTHLNLLAIEVAACQKCALHSTRTQTVFARGNPEALVCVIGEGPGQDEDEQGLPFVGRSGQLLDKAIRALGYDPATDIYVANIVKCRPPNNRKPLPEEIDACHPYLERQLDLLTKTKVLITLGATAMNTVAKQFRGITKVRGEVFEWKDKRVCVVMHPSWVLRNGGENSNAYDQFKDDIKLAFDLSKEKS